MRTLTLLTGLFLASGFLSVQAHEAASSDTEAAQYEKTSDGTRIIGWEGSEVEIKILLEPGNLGGSELEIGEITFPAGYEGAPHVHGVVEVFYPLEGTFQHWVSGEWHDVAAGSVATVRPGDEVIHRCASDIACKLLVIWGPSGEIERMQPSISRELEP
ncbi:MAG: cupin domain-containing protein [Pseudomonadota bacterium]